MVKVRARSSAQGREEGVRREAVPRIIDRECGVLPAKSFFRPAATPGG